VERGVVERRALQRGHVPERRLPSLAAVVAGGEEEVAGPPEVLAHREAADPADGEADREPEGVAVEDAPALQAVPAAEHRQADEEGGDEAAGELDAALPDGDDVDRVLDALGVGDRPGQAGADDAGEHHPGGHPVGLVAGDAEALRVAGGDPRAEQDAQRDHEPEGPQLERPQLDRGEGGVGDGCQHRPIVADPRSPCEPVPAPAQPSASGSIQPPTTEASATAPLGPQVPLRYSSTGAGLRSTGSTTRHCSSTPSARPKRRRSPSIASSRRRWYAACRCGKSEAYDTSRSTGRLTRSSPGAFVCSCRVTPSSTPSRNRSRLGWGRGAPDRAKSMRGG